MRARRSENPLAEHRSPLIIRETLSRCLPSAMCCDSGGERCKAQELGTTLKEYASKFQLGVQQLYQLRKPLVCKGCAWAEPAKEQRTADKVYRRHPLHGKQVGLV